MEEKHPVKLFATEEEIKKFQQLIDGAEAMNILMDVLTEKLTERVGQRRAWWREIGKRLGVDFGAACYTLDMGTGEITKTREWDK
jgi:hypothetical protein